MDVQRERGYPSGLSGVRPVSAAVAQWIEYWPPKPRVVGSIPASRATFSPSPSPARRPVPCNVGPSCRKRLQPVLKRIGHSGKADTHAIQNYQNCNVFCWEILSFAYTANTLRDINVQPAQVDIVRCLRCLSACRLRMGRTALTLSLVPFLVSFRADTHPAPGPSREE